MKMYRCLLPPALVAGLICLPGCKKEEDTQSEYLSGKLSLSLPAYVNPGYSKTFRIDTLMTLSRSDGGPIGYRFTDPNTGLADTLVTADGRILHHEYTLTVPDTVANKTLTLSAFVAADANYYGTSVSAPFTIVCPGWNDGASITNFTVVPGGTFTDERDGSLYHATEIGPLAWMRNNLAWEGAGVAFRRCAAMSGIFGRYYTWEEAQTACPPGWRLPSDAEWTQLEADAAPGKDIPGLAGRVMADLYFNGTKMWEYWREVPITDDLRLSAMPVGYATVGGGEYVFDGTYTYAAFWTSDESDGFGVCRYIYHDTDVVYRGRMSKTDFAASVRCVREL